MLILYVCVCAWRVLYPSSVGINIPEHFNLYSVYLYTVYICICSGRSRVVKIKIKHESESSSCNYLSMAYGNLTW